MAKGLDRHRERLEALAAFGRTLTRRSGSCCELCGASGVPLSVYEMPPVEETPDVEKCIFICTTCREGIGNPSRLTEHWRCLNTSVWSETPAVQVAAIRILRQIAPSQSWADELLEQLYIDPETEEWISAG